jgi:hypothetical protein
MWTWLLVGWAEERGVAAVVVVVAVLVIALWLGLVIAVGPFLLYATGLLALPWVVGAFALGAGGYLTAVAIGVVRRRGRQAGLRIS